MSLSRTEKSQNGEATDAVKVRRCGACGSILLLHFCIQDFERPQHAAHSGAYRHLWRDSGHYDPEWEHDEIEVRKFQLGHGSTRAMTLVSTKTTKPLTASQKSYEDTGWVS